jgi:hypothetical protein
MPPSPVRPANGFCLRCDKPIVVVSAEGEIVELDRTLPVYWVETQGGEVSWHKMPPSIAMAKHVCVKK